MMCKSNPLKILLSTLLIGIMFNLNAQIVGANFNERLQYIEEPSIKDSNVNWIRAFINVTQLVNISNGVITGVNQTAINNFDVSGLKSAAQIPTGNGTIKLILNLKFNFVASQLNRVPVSFSAEANYLVAAAKQILEKNDLGSEVDILVVGNEPMWETPTDQANVDRLGDFTLMMINNADDWRINTNGWNYNIYVGALNRFSDLPTNNIRNKILGIAKQNQKVSGLDLHMHVAQTSEINDDLNVLRNNASFTKSVIVTEFSIHRMLVNHKNDQLGSWGSQNDYPASMKVWEWVNTMLVKGENGNPVSASHFKSFFDSRAWYPQDWYQQFYNAFVQYNVHVGTSAFIRLIEPGFRLNANSDMWVVNALRNEAILGRNNSGLIIRNPLHYPVFKKIVGPFNDTDAFFQVKSKGSGKVLDISQCSNAAGANVQQWTWNGAQCQQWDFEFLSAGEYKIISRKSGLALDVSGCSDNNGANVQQWTLNEADCQRWLVQPLGGNEYRIISKKSGKSLDVNACSINDGANVQQWTWSGTDCQRWIINDASSASRVSVEAQIQDPTETEEGLVVYPNPTSDYFIVRTSGIETPVAIKVVNLSGQIIWRSSNTGGDIKISTENFTPGMYFIEASTDFKTVHRQKVLIQY